MLLSLLTERASIAGGCTPTAIFRAEARTHVLIPDGVLAVRWDQNLGYCKQEQSAATTGNILTDALKYKHGFLGKIPYGSNLGQRIFGVHRLWTPRFYVSKMTNEKKELLRKVWIAGIFHKKDYITKPENKKQNF